MDGLIQLWLVLSIISALWFVYICYVNDKKIRLSAKIMASFSFLLLGISCCIRTEIVKVLPYYPVLLIGALSLGVAGDVLLGLQKVNIRAAKKLFISGLVCFLAGHIFYALLFVRINKPSFPALLFFSLLILAMSKIEKVSKVRLGSMRRPVIVYGMIISTMVSIALGNLIMQPNSFSAIMAIAAVLFLISDMLLTVFMFRHNAPLWLRVVYPVAYYSAQILFALSPLFYLFVK